MIGSEYKNTDNSDVFIENYKLSNFDIILKVFRNLDGLIWRNNQSKALLMTSS